MTMTFRKTILSKGRSYIRGIAGRTLTLSGFLALGLAGSPAQAHGTWLGLPELQLSPATNTLVTNNVLAGKTPVVAGDIVEVIAAVPVITNGTISGGNGWITFYVPNGMQVVGASVVNTSLAAIPVRDATNAVDGDGLPKGWGDGNGQNTFNITANGWTPAPLPPECTTFGYTAANCNAGMAFTYGDTGIFYSTRADTALYTGDGSVITKYTNGYIVVPSSNQPWGSIGGSGSARVHNKWDAVQSNAFGSGGPSTLNPGFTTQENTRLAGGRGPTPYKAGSPVAGPDSASPLDRYGTTGPWQRISYPGSCIATNSAALGPANGRGSVAPEPVNNTSFSTSVCTPSSAGFVLSEANPLPLTANNIRFAIGGLYQGQTHRVMVRLKILDPNAIGVFNFAGSGGDASWQDATKDNMWRYWVGAPSNIPVSGQTFRLSIDKELVAVNGAPYTASMIVPPNATLRYRISYANTGPFIQTNVILSDVLPTQTTSTSNFTVIRGPDIRPATNPTGGTFSFKTIASLPALTGGAVEFDVKLTAATGTTVTNQARLVSKELPTALTDSVQVTISSPVANISVSKTVEVHDPDNLGLLAIPGNQVVYTIKVTNNGSPIDSGGLVITDPLPGQLIFFRGAFDATTPEPVKFVENSGATGLTCCGSGQVQYSTNGGLSYAYLPPSGLDPAITHLRVTPTGALGTGSSFSILFRAEIE